MPRRVLITGGTGFLGRYIARAWRDERGEMTLLGRSKSGNDIVCDLGDGPPDLSAYAFETVIHCAGKAHSRPRNQSDDEEFFRVNVEGTRNLLRSLEDLVQKPERIIFVSSVSVYGKDEGIDIDETGPLNGDTPYAKSKISAEELVRNWATGNQTAYFNLRLPLVVGADPPGNLRALAESIRKGRYVRVRNNEARKSMVLASDVAHLTLLLDSRSGNYNLTDLIDPKFCEVEEAIAESVGKRMRRPIPRQALKLACGIGTVLSLPLNNDFYSKITSSLTFSSGLAVRMLDWRPGSCLSFINCGGLFGETE